MDVRVGLWRKLSAEELMLLNCDVGEDSWASLGLARRYNQSILKEISSEHSLEGLMLKLKLQYFGHLMRRTDSFENPWCWERLKAGGERDDRGWDGCMASLTQWTWVWVNPGSWWWTGRSGVLQSMGSQRVGHDWATELSWDFKTISRLGQWLQAPGNTCLVALASRSLFQWENFRSTVMYAKRSETRSFEWWQHSFVS